MHIPLLFPRYSPLLRLFEGENGGGGGSSATGGSGDGKDDGDGKSGDDGKDDGEGDGTGKDGQRDADDDETLREPGKRALAREREARAAAEREKAELEARLRKLEDAGLTEQQKIERDLAEAKAEAEKATARLLRYEVAEAKELPAGWANRLQGSTREELAADADQLLEQLKSAGTGRQKLKPDHSQGRGGGDQKQKGSVSSGADLYAEMRSAKSKN